MSLFRIMSDRYSEYVPLPGPATWAHMSPARRVGYGGARGGGKALLYTTPIPTPTGWTTMGELKNGDSVFDEKGRPCRVILVSEINPNLELYCLTFDDGEKIVACVDHRWVTMNSEERRLAVKRTPEFRARRRASRPSRGKAILKNEGSSRNTTRMNKERVYANLLTAPVGTIRTTKEIVDTLLTKNGDINHSIAVTGSLDLPEVDLPVDPYLLGVWLGDGASESGQIAAHESDHERLIVEFERGGFPIDGIKDKDSLLFGGFCKALRLAGLKNNKHIPLSYLRASRAQRLALLQGLMDTDGTVKKGSGAPQFDNTNYALIEGILELVRSLGWKPSVLGKETKLYGKICKPSWRVQFMATEPVFRMPRKIAKQKLASSPVTRRRYIVSAERVPSAPGRCISVDSPSHMYLAGNGMIPTHNSEWLLADVLRYVNIPEFKAIITRRTYKLLEELLWRASRRYKTAKWQGQPHNQFLFPSGATIKFISFQHEKDTDDYIGAEYHYLGIDQAEQFTEKMVDNLESCVRSSYPHITPFIRYTSNPGGVGHKWFKKRMVDACRPIPSGAPVYLKDFNLTYQPVIPGKIFYDRAGVSSQFIPSRVFDNPYILKNDPEYVKRLLMLPEKRRMAYLYGSYDTFSGQFFDSWESDIHVVKPFEIPAKWDLWAAFDWGFSHNGCYLLAATNYAGEIYIIREIVKNRTGIKEWAEMIKTLHAPFPQQVRIRVAGLDLWERLLNERASDDTIKSYPSDDTLADIFRKNGVEFMRADTRRTTGWNAIREYLEFRNSKLPYPKLRIFNCCTQLIECLPNLIEDDLNPEDVEKVEGDDPGDALRYLVMAASPTHGKPTKKEGWRAQMEANRKNERGVTFSRVKGGWADVEDDENFVISYSRR